MFRNLLIKYKFIFVLDVTINRPGVYMIFNKFYKAESSETFTRNSSDLRLRRSVETDVFGNDSYLRQNDTVTNPKNNNGGSRNSTMRDTKVRDTKVRDTKVSLQLLDMSDLKHPDGLLHNKDLASLDDITKKLDEELGVIWIGEHNNKTLLDFRCQQCNQEFVLISHISNHSKIKVAVEDEQFNVGIRYEFLSDEKDGLFEFYRDTDSTICETDFAIATYWIYNDKVISSDNFYRAKSYEIVFIAINAFISQASGNE